MSSTERPPPPILPLSEEQLLLYLQRIGVARSYGPPVHALLHRITYQHALTIPFENFSILLKEQIEIHNAATMIKIVLSERGGYCFETNSLLAAALVALGFQVALRQVSLALKGMLSVSFKLTCARPSHKRPGSGRGHRRTDPRCPTFRGRTCVSSCAVSGQKRRRKIFSATLVCSLFLHARRKASLPSSQDSTAVAARHIVCVELNGCKTFRGVNRLSPRLAPGYGGGGPAVPLPLRAGEEYGTPQGETYRLSRGVPERWEDSWLLEARDLTPPSSRGGPSWQRVRFRSPASPSTLEPEQPRIAVRAPLSA